MAKMKPGPLVGSVSGSIGGQVFSHNRYGPYIRTRSIPVTVESVAALAAKARLTECSQAYASLTDAQRNAWKNWAQANPVVDALGEKQELDGHAAYVQINTRMLIAGVAKLSTPPTSAAPAPLATLAATFDIGAGSTELTFTATPLGATKSLWLVGAQVSNPAINYVKNLQRFIFCSAANLASPYDYQTVVEARLGTLVVGKKLVLFGSVLDRATGLLSSPLRVEGTIVTT